MSRVLAGSFIGLMALASGRADAQVYPDRILVKARAAAVTTATAYQRRDRGDEREQVDRTTKTFRLGENGSLSLGNIAGDITVTRGSGNETTVEIVKTARGRDADDARELLQLVTVEVTERNGRADVKTHYPSGDEARRNNRRNLNVNVAYVVTAPAGTRVSVESISGNVKIADIKGDLTAQSVSGDVRISGAGRIGTAKSVSGSIEIADAQVDGALMTGSVSGDVVLRHVSARRIEGQSVSGSLRLEDIQCERINASTTSGNITFSGALARNWHYELKGFSGDVRIQLAGTTGFELDASTFSGQIRSDDFPITSRGRVDRRTLSGTYGDGSAMLDLQTFSGSIVISKR